MSFFTTSDGKSVNGADGFEGGASLEPIPHGEKIVVMIESASWRTGVDAVDRIKTKARVIDGPHTNRVVFDTLDICSQDPKRRDKHVKKFAAVDYVAGTGIVDRGEIPSDEALYGFVGCELEYTMGIFQPKPSERDPNPGPVNYVMAIKKPGQAAPAAPKSQAKPAAAAPKGRPSFEDDVPF